MEFLKQNPFVILVLAGGLLYLVLVASAMRQGAAWLFQAFCTALVAMFVARMLATSQHVAEPYAQYIGVGFAGIIFFAFPKRSRHIPSGVRKRVITKHIGKGRQYNPKEHHLDHIVPFSKGGSHTHDNLRVVEKKKNLKKGAKMPTPSDWF